MTTTPLKFTLIDKAYQVTLSFDEPKIEKDRWGPGEDSIWYGIEEDLETGATGFNASNDLHAIIQLLNMKKESTFIIKKLKGDNYTYFTVNDKKLNELSPIQNTSEPADIKITTLKPDISMEEQVKIMWNWFLDQGLYEPKKKVSKVEKSKDDDLPF